MIRHDFGIYDGVYTTWSSIDGDWVKWKDVEKLEEENNHLKRLNRELVLRNELLAQTLYQIVTFIPES